jgi:hypothetical protein
MRRERLRSIRTLKRSFTATSGPATSESAAGVASISTACAMTRRLGSITKANPSAIARSKSESLRVFTFHFDAVSGAAMLLWLSNRA